MKRWVVGCAVLVLLALAMVGVTQAAIVLSNNEQITIDAPYPGEMTPHDTSHAFIVPGGSMYNVYAYDASTVDVSAGSVPYNLYTFNTAVVSMSDGFVGTVLAYDTSEFNILGGAVPWLYARSSSKVDVSGGSINYLIANNSSAVTLNARDFQLGIGLTVAGDRLLGTGILSGKWMDGTPWRVEIVENDSEATIRLQDGTVPEPSTLIVWSLLGGLAVAIGWSRRRRFVA
jgi:hypothetical protein